MWQWHCISDFYTQFFSENTQFLQNNIALKRKFVLRKTKWKGSVDSKGKKGIFLKKNKSSKSFASLLWWFIFKVKDSNWPVILLLVCCISLNEITTQVSTKLLYKPNIYTKISKIILMGILCRVMLYKLKMYISFRMM